MDGVWRNLRLALRSVRRQPGYAATVIAVLAIGIGATTAIFSATNAYFLRPLPFADADRLVALYETNPEFGWTDAEAAPANVLDWRERVGAFEDVAAYSYFGDRVVWAPEGEPILLTYAQVTGNFFDVLRPGSMSGPGLAWRDTWSDGQGGVVISHRLWRDRFGSRADVVGSMLELETSSARIVGIAPPGLGFPSHDVDVWVPFGWNPDSRPEVFFRRAHFLRPIARLVPGASVESADAEFQGVVASLQQEYPETNRVMGAGMRPLRDFLIRDIRTTLLLLQGAVALLLLLACVNIANLSLLRAAARTREVALQRALGAGDARVAWRFLSESLVLAGIGGGLGLGLGWTCVRLIDRTLPLGIDGATTLTLDARVLTLALVLSVVSGLVFGLAPLARTRRMDLGDTLREGERGSSRGQRTARVLVGLEVALALVLVVGAGLMLRTGLALRNVDPGFDTDGAVAIQLSTPSTRYEDRDAVLAFWDEVSRSIEARPGIEAVGTVGQLPLNGAGWSSQFQAEGWPADRAGLDIVHRHADAGYFAALDIPLIRGRLFEEGDVGGERVALINLTFAETFFPGEDPIGRRIAYDRVATADSRWYEIVGIVGDQRQTSPADPVRPEAFEFRSQDWSRTMWVVIESEGSTADVVATARDVLAGIDPLTPVEDVRPIHALWRDSMARQSRVLGLLGAFAMVALLLASVGVWAVTAEMAGRRRREMGIRLALGAERGDLISMVVRKGMAVVVVGLGVGVGAVLLLSRSIAGLLFGVSPNDPATLVGVGLVLALTAFAACWIPAWRATRVDPARSLRAEA